MHPDDHGEQHRRDGDGERDAGAEDHAGQQVAAELIGAEQVMHRGALETMHDVLLVWAVRSDHGCSEHNDEEQAPRR